MSGKAPGNDGIPAEIFKLGGNSLKQKLHELFITIWGGRGCTPRLQRCLYNTFIPNKGARNVCDNHRDISLLSVAGKSLVRVVLNRIIKHVVPNVYPESQCGFRSGKGTVDMIFALRQMQEKFREQNNDLCMVFINLT